MKILEVIPNFDYGGAETLVWNFCNIIDVCKNDVTVLLYNKISEKGKSRIEELSKRGIKFICLNKDMGFKPKMFFKVYKVVKEVKPDVIHMHLNSLLYLFPYYVFNKKQRGYQTIHNLAEKDQVGIHRKILKWLFKHRNVNPVAISHLIQETIYKLYGVNKKDIPIIYNGINTEFFALSNKRDYSSNITKFIAVGRFVEQKNYPLMIDSFADAYVKNKNIRLTILGDGSLREEIEEKIRNLKIEKIVNIMGNVNNVQDYLGESHCFLMSSDFEGLPLSVLEAMSTGLPIISTKAGGVVDIIEDGCNGKLVEIGDKEGLTEAILKLSDHNILREMSIKSFRIAKRYDISLCVKQYEELFLNN